MRPTEARTVIESLSTLSGIAMPHVKQCCVCGAPIVKPPNQGLDHPHWIRRSVCSATCRKAKMSRKLEVDFEAARRTRIVQPELEYE